MKILVLEDDKGAIWHDFAVVVETGDWSEGYYRRQAEDKIFRRFSEYWFHNRFPRQSDDFAKEVGKTLLLNGWKIKALTTEQPE